MIKLIGYVAVVALSLWTVGPWLGLVLVPIAVPLAGSFQRASTRWIGGPVNAQQAAHELGRDIVLAGRAFCVGVLPTMYLHLAAPGAAWYYDAWLFVPVWWMSRGRLSFPLLTIAAQFATRALIRS